MVEAEGFEEVLIDDVGSGGDDGVDHVVAEEVDEDLLEAGGDEGAGQAEDDSAVGVAEHHFVDAGGAGCVAGGVGHVGHGVDDRDDVVLFHVEVLDGAGEEFFFGGHGNIQDSNFGRSCRWFGVNFRLVRCFLHGPPSPPCFAQNLRIKRLRFGPRCEGGFNVKIRRGAGPACSISFSLSVVSSYRRSYYCE